MVTSSFPTPTGGGNTAYRSVFAIRTVMTMGNFDFSVSCPFWSELEHVVLESCRSGMVSAPVFYHVRPAIVS